MEEQKKNPELRFEGFTDDWEEKAFTSFVDRISTSSNLEGIPRIEYEDIISGSGELNKDLSKKKSTKKGLEFEPNDVLYGKLRPYLKNWIHSDFNGIAVGDFWILRSKESDGNFIYNLIQTNRFDKIANQSTGSKMPRAEWGLVSGSIFSIPKNVREREQIGSFFKNIDELITKHQKKHNRLVTLKKSMLEKMFPKEGQSVPEIRFKGFEGEWEEEEFESLAEFTKGQGYSKNDLKASGTPIVLYGRLYTNYQTRIDDVDTFVEAQENSYYSKGGEVIVPASGETQEDIVRASVIIKSDIILGGDLNIIRPNESIDSNYLALVISYGKVYKELVKKAQGKSVVHIRNTDLKETNIPHPKKEEQEKIGCYFKNIDDLISNHQKQLQKLKNFKQSLSEKMFV